MAAMVERIIMQGLQSVDGQLLLLHFLVLRSNPSEANHVKCKFDFVLLTWIIAFWSLEPSGFLTILTFLISGLSS